MSRRRSFGVTSPVTAHQEGTPLAGPDYRQITDIMTVSGVRRPTAAVL